MRSELFSHHEYDQHSPHRPGCKPQDRRAGAALRGGLGLDRRALCVRCYRLGSPNRDATRPVLACAQGVFDAQPSSRMTAPQPVMIHQMG